MLLFRILLVAVVLVGFGGAILELFHGQLWIAFFMALAASIAYALALIIGPPREIEGDWP